ncbi:hypothetical protein [uncultured Shimia sp.]|nr:hypothetical protein [uncultured Shimia sp.]
MPEADEIWTGGTILTMDPQTSRAEALAVKAMPNEIRLRRAGLFHSLS